jgi:hypothetical protein
MATSRPGQRGAGRRSCRRRARRPVRDNPSPYDFKVWSVGCGFAVAFIGLSPGTSLAVGLKIEGRFHVEPVSKTRIYHKWSSASSINRLRARDLARMTGSRTGAIPRLYTTAGTRSTPSRWNARQMVGARSPSAKNEPSLQIANSSSCGGPGHRDDASPDRYRQHGPWVDDAGDVRICPASVGGQ